MKQFKKLSAREKAIQQIGIKNVEALEHQGIMLSWKHEYDLKEIIIAAEADEEILIKLDQIQKGQ